MFGTNLYSAVNCTSLCSTSVVMLSMLLLLTATLRIAKSSEKLFGTFGRDGWDHDPLIRVVIKNRGKSFLPSDFISGMVTQFMVSLRQLALYVRVHIWLKKSDFPRWQQFIVYLIHTVMASTARRRPVAAVAACSAPSGDILAMCIIIIIVSLSPLVCAASPPRHRRL